MKPRSVTVRFRKVSNTKWVQAHRRGKWRDFVLAEWHQTILDLAGPEFRISNRRPSKGEMLILACPARYRTPMTQAHQFLQVGTFCLEFGRMFGMAKTLYLLDGWGRRSEARQWELLER